jgi:arylsulfatase A
VRVPFIVRGPGVKSGAVSDVPVCSIDVLPTIAEICGVPMNTKPDGVSIKKVLAGEGTLEPRALYWHYPHYANQGGKPGAIILEGNLKMIEFYENGRRELFDVVADKGESRNLAEQQTEKVAAMAKKLDAWRKSVNAQMPTPNPNYLPNPQAKNGTVTLPARDATVHGVQLRYEPLPHKNTLGYWTRVDDYATWEFELAQPGTYTVTVLQGCGKGNGGSEVQVSSGDSAFTFTVKDTGGFQNFEAREVGKLTFEKAGRHTLTVKPLKKAANAVMDVRQIVLKPEAKK